MQLRNPQKLQMYWIYICMHENTRENGKLYRKSDANFSYVSCSFHLIFANAKHKIEKFFSACCCCCTSEGFFPFFLCNVFRQLCIIWIVFPQKLNIFKNHIRALWICRKEKKGGGVWVCLYGGAACKEKDMKISTICYVCKHFAIFIRPNIQITLTVKYVHKSLKHFVENLGYNVCCSKNSIHNQRWEWERERKKAPTMGKTNLCDMETILLFCNFAFAWNCSVGLSANIVHKEIHHRWWKSILNAIERNISSEFSRNIVSSTTMSTTKLLRARRHMHTVNRLLHSSSSSIFAYIHQTHM